MSLQSLAGSLLPALLLVSSSSAQPVARRVGTARQAVPTKADFKLAGKLVNNVFHSELEKADPDRETVQKLFNAADEADLGGSGRAQLLLAAARLAARRNDETVLRRANTELVRWYKAQQSKSGRNAEPLRDLAQEIADEWLTVASQTKAPAASDATACAIAWHKLASSDNSELTPSLEEALAWPIRNISLPGKLSLRMIWIGTGKSAADCFMADSDVTLGQFEAVLERKPQQTRAETQVESAGVFTWNEATSMIDQLNRMPPPGFVFGAANDQELQQLYQMRSSTPSDSISTADAIKRFFDLQAGAQRWNVDISIPTGKVSSDSGRRPQGVRTVESQRHDTNGEPDDSATARLRLVLRRNS